MDTGHTPENFRFWLVQFCPGLNLVLTALWTKPLLTGQMFNLGCFVLIWWQTNPEAELTCKDLFIWIQLPIVLSIFRSDNIYNVEVNGALSIQVIVHNSLTQNRNRLTFWIEDSYVDIYVLMT